ncbi:hypothetical protein MMC27_000527 [Xylographa pallens]|nr:hypothetical protein [Xylographa pallens]
MTVTKRALEDDDSETVSQAKRIASVILSKTANSTPRLRLPIQADTIDRMTVTKRALEDDHGETAPQAKRVAAAVPTGISNSTPLLRSPIQADTTDNMTVTKRALEDDHGDAGPQAKKMATPNSAEDKSVQRYLDRIAELEKVIEQYEAFFDQEGLFLDIPESQSAIIDLRPNGATKLASSLKSAIHTAYAKLYDTDGPDITNDDYSDELMTFLPDIERLANLQDGPRLAWNVLLLLVDKSRTDDPGNGYNCNKRYSPYDFLDKAMLEVAIARWKGSKMKNGKEIKEMQEDAAHIAEVANLVDAYGVKNYLRRTRAFLAKVSRTISLEKSVAKDGGRDHGAGDTKKAYKEEDHATVDKPKQDKYHDTGIGQEV